MPSAIPWDEIETLFLDLGNTLVSMDFAWISRELGARGVESDAASLRRAEARVRPVLSSRLDELRSTEGPNAFAVYLGLILERASSTLAGADVAALVEELIPVLRGSGTHRLWSSVLPGVPEALAAFRSAGLRLVAVSNSDGTAALAIREQGLEGHFDAIFDSHWVGFEKPDPRIFQHALEATDSRGDRTLHVGDLYAADVVGARSAGIHALLLDPYDDWQDVDCERLPDLAALRQRLLR